MSFLQYFIEFLLGVWRNLLPFIIVDVYEAGVVLRLGKYHKNLAPGLNWRVPLLDVPIVVTTVINTECLSPQTLTTADGTSVVITAIVKYEIVDVKPYILTIFDRTAVLKDTTMGAIHHVVQQYSFEDLWAEDLEKIATKEVRKNVAKYGFKVHKITFCDFGQIRSIRLITDGSETVLDAFDEEE